MSDPDISSALEDQRFIAEVELALTNDLRKADIFVDVMWHQQGKEFYLFRFEADTTPSGFDIGEITKALINSDAESMQFEMSAPYMLKEDLVVSVKRPNDNGTLYDSDGEQYT